MSATQKADDYAKVEWLCHVKQRTRWCDEDNQNVLNNAVYMTLLEEARVAYFLQLGYTLSPPLLLSNSPAF